MRSQLRVSARLLLSLLLPFGGVACDDDGGPAADAGTNVLDAAADGALDASMVVDGAEVEAGGGPDAELVDGATDGGTGLSCRGSGSVELRPMLKGGSTAASDGRLVVLWYQFSDDGPPPPMKVAYDAPFNGAATSVTINAEQLATPEPSHLLCLRDCDDYEKCPCTSNEFRAAFAWVGVMRDADASGAIEASEIRDAKTFLANVRGVARMAFVCSDRVHPAGFLPHFPEGVRAGIQAYRVFQPDPESFERLGTPAANQSFELQVCSGGSASCDLDHPNLH